MYESIRCNILFWDLYKRLWIVIFIIWISEAFIVLPDMALIETFTQKWWWYLKIKFKMIRRLENHIKEHLGCITYKLVCNRFFRVKNRIFQFQFSITMTRGIIEIFVSLSFTLIIYFLISYTLANGSSFRTLILSFKVWILSLSRAVFFADFFCVFW